MAKLAAFVFFALSLLASHATELEQQFQQPPVSTRPRVLWMWMNGNVSAVGITKDLEAMKRVGIGGALVFNPGQFIPKGPVDYGSQQWRDLMVHAGKEADRLRLDFAMHNAPGWSSSGGPWITPEMSMQELVWSELRIAGGEKQALPLPQPTTRFNHYRDVCVLAIPSLPGEEKQMSDLLAEVVVNNVTNAGHCSLTDGDWNTGTKAGPENPIVLKFAEPFEARSLTVCYRSGNPAAHYDLDASDDGVNYRRAAQLSPNNAHAIEDAPITGNFDAVKARFFRITPSRPKEVLEVELNAAPRIEAWQYKGDYTHRPAQNADLPTWVPKKYATDPADVIDLTKHVDAQGQLTWKAPKGSWTILRFGYTPRGQTNIAAPDTGAGLECDKLSKAGVEFHFEHGIKPLLDALGPLTGKTFTGLEVDSYEVGMQNWTGGFENEFKKRNGYDLTSYLPAMTGRFVGSADISERFLWDFRRTVAQMLSENYYGRLRELCHQHGLGLYVEPYGSGPGPYDEIQVGGEVDVPMGEFWSRFPWDDTPSVRLAASAAHTHGKAVVAGESFTAEPEQSRWLEYPFALKPLGDYVFSLGLNRMFFHRSAHQPNPTAMPGMTMGPWGIHFERTLTWFDQSSGWLDYLARCQFLLQQGEFVADVLYFTGEGSPQYSKLLKPQLPEGYTFDAVDTQTLLQAHMERGRIVLPCGISYRVLALPPDLKSMTPETLRYIREMVAEGMTLVGPKPMFSPSLRFYPNNDTEIEHLVDATWSITNVVVFTNRPIGDVLRETGVKPDFEYAARPDTALVWLHRHTENAEIYFVANRQRRSEDAVCTFRVQGKQPELWDPATGEIKQAAIFDFDDGLVHVPIHFDSAGSMFVVFRRVIDAKPEKWLARDGVKIINAEPVPGAETNADVTGDFSVAAWVKPDTNMRTMPKETTDGKIDESGKGFLVAAGDGETIFGPNHAVMGLAVGRNGVFVVERVNTNTSPAVLSSIQPLSGWTHVAVVYHDGKPSLYVNGKFVREGLKSGRIVHPGVALKPVGKRLVYYFEGDSTPVQFFAKAISTEQIAAMAANPLPAPAGPEPVEVSRDNAGKVEALVWQSGNYTLSDKRSLKASVDGPTEIKGPWNVSFPPDLGAPTAITLPELQSLRLNSDSGVQHFSGTATYTRTFMVPETALAKDRRLFLDLGRVEVTARVKVNGHDEGILWKPPYRVDITAAAHAGTNQLEVAVADLWPNRLIGDEALPPENDYNPRTHAIEKLPDWYVKGQPKPPGGRTTFTTWHFYEKTDPLVESGLLGPVRLWNPVERTFGK